MALNWNEIATKAAKNTDESLTVEISSLTTMSDSEIEELFPTPSDKERLAKLMSIVKSADDRNTKINKIVNNIKDLADTVITLAGKVA